MQEQLELAYLAGIVDGEGSISIKTESKARPYTIYLAVTNTNYEMIRLFEDKFGGKVRKRNWSKASKVKGSERWKDCYEWTLTKNLAAKAIVKLFPYIRIKKKQAVLVMRAFRIKTKYPAVLSRWQPKLHAKKLRLLDKIKQACKKLNQRGKPKEEVKCQ